MLEELQRRNFAATTIRTYTILAAGQVRLSYERAI